MIILVVSVDREKVNQGLRPGAQQHLETGKWRSLQPLRMRMLGPDLSLKTVIGIAEVTTHEETLKLFVA